MVDSITWTRPSTTKLADGVMNVLVISPIFRPPDIDDPAVNLQIVRDVKAARPLLAKGEINVAVLDVEFGALAGFQFMGTLRSKKDSPCPGLPVIMLMKESDPDLVRKIIRVGGDSMLIKPIRHLVLFEHCRELIDQPQRWVDVGDYLGPDRRRVAHPGYGGDERRRTRGAVTGAD